MKSKKCFRVAILMAAIMTTVFAQAADRRPGHVVVVGIDGMRGDSVEQAQTPNMRALMARGVSTMKAAAVLPTVSSPNWASVLMGALPDTHKVLSNDWQPGQTPPFPTLFDVLRNRYKKAHMAAIYEWAGFGRLFNHVSVDFCASAIMDAVKPDPNISPALRMTTKAAEVIKINKPLFTFLHLDLVDHAGHASGYGSPEYLAAVSEADRLLGQILQAVADAGITDKTAVFVLSDHGGKDKRHGGSSPEETTVPWMAAGPGLAAGKTLAEPISIAQTAPTIARLLRVKCPAAWTQQPIVEAFAKH
ncbi:MAG TPA: ectonucleotide pyrophosphatase/phosphodiesterase [Candidatus Hydrogenedentes bacterium]|nr:ectonucleotide pyrophosphatase/phosphodiesterase [Candidatus Hydrogenedentota bacterium]HPC16817.1 ectonucleotide pyrophosphatase/phosphodiesterase [Candidatus Hydrogenedentota bacterium]HRT18536.1 ectonucleotide pyrophosphatase/phosphodiesterase [Candidatus Hydrogenedentota bacterium]HRT63555.1 ectonucleotide pyrophosphatase/phosphodiesterase [Candidatus Hydrogenedentota bacterium]